MELLTDIIKGMCCAPREKISSSQQALSPVKGGDSTGLVGEVDSGERPNKEESIANAKIPKASLEKLNKSHKPRGERPPKIWSDDEDKLLIDAAKRFQGGNWKEVASLFFDRKPMECCRRWKILQPRQTRRIWTAEEDNMLVQLVAKHGSNWAALSHHFVDRTGKQVRDRYLNNLDPKINRSKFTDEEDYQIVQQFYRLGPRWAEIAKTLHGRSENMVKNRFYSHIRKKMPAAEIGPPQVSEMFQAEPLGPGALLTSSLHLLSIPQTSTMNHQMNGSLFDNPQEINLDQPDQGLHYERAHPRDHEEQGYLSAGINPTPGEKHPSPESISFYWNSHNHGDDLQGNPRQSEEGKMECVNEMSNEASFEQSPSGQIPSCDAKSDDPVLQRLRADFSTLRLNNITGNQPNFISNANSPLHRSRTSANPNPPVLASTANTGSLASHEAETLNPRFIAIRHLFWKEQYLETMLSQIREEIMNIKAHNPNNNDHEMSVADSHPDV